MRWQLCSVVLLIAVAFPDVGHAGIFGKKNKPNPKERVPELLATVKNDKDEGKRASAAEELRQYDTTTFPDIIPVLIDVLLHDAKTSVRSEAADSLGKIRPITQEVGQALEQALAKDSSMRVRLQARYALMGYSWSGYGKEKSKEAAAKESLKPIPAPVRDTAKGPPLPPPPVINTQGTQPPPTGRALRAEPRRESSPPPLADPPAAPTLPRGIWRPATVPAPGLKIPELPSGPPPGPGPILDPPPE